MDAATNKREYVLPHQRQRMEIALDVLKGCVYSCEGCMVDRELYATTDVTGDVTAMVDEFTTHGFYPYDITIGATDFGSARNVTEIASNPEIGALVRRFQTISITSPMLDKHDEYYVNMAKNLKALTHGECFVRIVMPIGVNHMTNITLMTALQRRLRMLDMYLDGMLHEITFILNMTEDLFERYTFDELIDIYKWPKMNMMMDTVLNIPHGRMDDIGTNPTYGPSIARVGRRMSEFYKWMDADVEVISQRDPDLDGVSGTHINIGVIGDKAYVIPYLKDEFNIFSPGFAIEDLSYASAMAVIRDMKTANPEWMIPACEGCSEVAFCVEKGIHKVMGELAIDVCPIKHDV